MSRMRSGSCDGRLVWDVGECAKARWMSEMGGGEGKMEGEAGKRRRMAKALPPKRR